MNKYTLPGCRVSLSPIGPEHSYLVAKWRNQQDSRDSFFNTDVVTPDTHLNFLKNRNLHDLVWVVHAHNDILIGMTALKVNVKDYTAEYGRTYIDHGYRGKGFARDTEYLVLHFAFDMLRLDKVWLDALTSNVAIIQLHHKTGYKDIGIDLPCHTSSRGPVIYMEYSNTDWEKKSHNFG